ncbi:M6 family metalloprotease domain-containing protein [Paenibacillus illinoisensis]|uniref:M6 family metalloprotease domain-containing protein n=1 Tax=Paenibacillus illinoisensis TaxID=59845 RepID=UPI003015A164
MNELRLVPPSPAVQFYILNEYRTKWKNRGFSFEQFLFARGYQNPAHDLHGMDDNVTNITRDGHNEFISIPHTPVTGTLRVLVLLVDFPDEQGILPKSHYEELLFSKKTSLTGSLSDYYEEVSSGKVHIEGEVHGWLRMPQDYSYYTNGSSGMSESYPNARVLAEDAVKTALSKGITFDPSLDKLGNHEITALFIVHAGLGAEKLNPSLRGNHIWSHKWVTRNPIEVSPNLYASTYLMVPQDAKLGVCAHELGHLAFQWQDFYDPNYDEDGDHWDGTGMWDLMASGSYAGSEVRPIHPAGLHKSQHGWVEVEEFSQSSNEVVLPPVTGPEGKVLKIYGPGYTKGQYLLLENRIKDKFDGALPGEGLLVWRVDEGAEQEGSHRPGMMLIQADGRNDLNDPNDLNAGDAGDPFPGSKKVSDLNDSGVISTSFSDIASGVSLRNISFDEGTKQVQLDIVIEG